MQPSWGPSPGGSEFGQTPAAPEPPRRRTGCIVAVVVALALVCLGSVAMFLTCGGCMSWGKRERVSQITMHLRASLADNPNAAVYEPDLARLEALNRDDDVDFLAFGILENRYKDATLDRTIDAQEMDHLMTLVRDIVAGEGRVNLQSYPTGR